MASPLALAQLRAAQGDSTLPLAVHQKVETLGEMGQGLSGLSLTQAPGSP